MTEQQFTPEIEEIFNKWKAYWRHKSLYPQMDLAIYISELEKAFKEAIDVIKIIRRQSSDEDIACCLAQAYLDTLVPKKKETP